MKKINKNVRGITLVALAVTIIVLLILAGIAINLTIGNNGLFTRAKESAEEHIKQEASEAMNLKISGIQIQSYTENQKLPDLQYLADRLCEDDEMQYVIKKEKEKASLDKIDVSNVDSIFTKIKRYPYEFEINSHLQLESIDGVKLADVNNSTNSSEEIEELKIIIKGLQKDIESLNSNVTSLNEKNNALETEIKNITDEKITYTHTELASLKCTTANTDTEVTLKDNLENYKYVMIACKTESGNFYISGMVPISLFASTKRVGAAGGEKTVAAVYIDNSKCMLRGNAVGVTTILYGIK